MKGLGATKAPDDWGRALQNFPKCLRLRLKSLFFFQVSRMQMCVLHIFVRFINVCVAAPTSPVIRVAEFDYTKQREDELSFSTGDRIEVVRTQPRTRTHTHTRAYMHSTTHWTRDTGC